MTTTLQAALATAAFVALLGATTGAQAQAGSAGPYLLAAGGASAYETDCTGLQQCDSSAAAYKGAIGMRFGGGLGLEAVLIDFGSIKASNGSASGALQVRGAGVAAVFTSEFGGGWRSSVRLGVLSVRARGTGALYGTQVSDQSQTSLEGYAGINIGLAFTKNVALEAGWDSTRGALGSDGGRVAAATLGLLLSF